MSQLCEAFDADKPCREIYCGFVGGRAVCLKHLYHYLKARMPRWFE